MTLVVVEYLLVIGIGTSITAFLLKKFSKLENREIRYIVISILTVALFGAIYIANILKSDLLFKIGSYLLLVIEVLCITFPTLKNPIVKFLYLFFLKAYSVERLYTPFRARMLFLAFLLYDIGLTMLG